MSKPIQWICAILFLLFSNQNVSAQVGDPPNSNSPNNIQIVDTTGLGDLVTNDTSSLKLTKNQKKEKFKLIKSILDKKYPNPNRAAALSLALPGAGQVYNKKYWKLPIVYGALAGLGYVAYVNNNFYKDFREAYLFEIDDDPLTVNPFVGVSSSTLLTLRDRANKRRQQGYIFFVAGWILNSVDAYVDAHLASFDVNEDISLQLNPAGIYVANETAYGVSLHFTYKNDPLKVPTFKY